ncbi:50S ribosomal protein L11 methyltransferase [Thermodesulfobacteriota bacterium]
MNNPPQWIGWLEISIDVDPIAHEAIGAFLFDLGCEGIILEALNDPTLKAYLPFRKSPEDIRSRIDLFLRDLKEIFPEAGSPELRLNKVENQDWDISWRRFFSSDQVTQRLMIIPAWEPIPDSMTCHVIRIDPGPAFGTGKHPTTRMCLQAMEQACFSGLWTSLDIGTGSGILAIYSVTLGSDRALALDIDPEAIRWAKRNIELNDLSVEIELSSKHLKDWNEHFSLITANLVLGTILDLCPHFSRLLAPGGWLILSGILREQVEDVTEKLIEHELYKDQVLFQEEWACVIARSLDDK